MTEVKPITEATRVNPVSAMRAQQIRLAFNRYDSEKKGLLSYSQVQEVLMSFGVRPSEQNLDNHMSKDSLAEFHKVSAIVQLVIPVELMKARVLRALMGEDARQERRASGNVSKTAIDGLIGVAFLKEILQDWKVGDEVIDDAFGSFMTPDDQLDYCQLVDALWD